MLKEIHLRMRREKLNFFFSLVGDVSKESLLDVGGGPGFEGEFNGFRTRFGFSCAMNLTASWVKGASGYPILGDGCQMPFASGSFDWVFSNAVIEHVGSWEQQRRFAEEIRRVARKGYFIATPNRTFPIDPHTLLPFFQYLSHSHQKIACRVALRSWMRREPQAVDLLSERDLHKLFPEATVRGLGLPILKNNLVAFFKAA